MQAKWQGADRHGNKTLVAVTAAYDPSDNNTANQSLPLDNQTPSSRLMWEIIWTFITVQLKWGSRTN